MITKLLFVLSQTQYFMRGLNISRQIVTSFNKKLYRDITTINSNDQLANVFTKSMWGQKLTLHIYCIWAKAHPYVMICKIYGYMFLSCTNANQILSHDYHFSLQVSTLLVYKMIILVKYYFSFPIIVATKQHLLPYPIFSQIISFGIYLLQSSQAQNKINIYYKRIKGFSF